MTAQEIKEKGREIAWVNGWTTYAISGDPGSCHAISEYEVISAPSYKEVLSEIRKRGRRQ